jgi:hypothetical protein
MTPESKTFQHLARDYAKLKAEREDWMRLAFDMLSTFKENQDSVITQERVDCWRAEWSRISGLDYAEHGPSA